MPATDRGGRPSPTAGGPGRRGAARSGLLLSVAAGAILVGGLVLFLMQGEESGDVRPAHVAPSPPPDGDSSPQAGPRSPSIPGAGGAPPPPTADLEVIDLPPELAAEAADVVVQLHDHLTGDPVASEIELWPLALMGTADHPPTPRRARVPEEGLRLTGLPPGIYRAHVRARRRNAEDPPDFLVQAPVTEVRLAVDRGRPLLAVLEIFDEDGRPVPMANLASGWRGQPAVHDPFGLLDEAQPLDERRMDFGSRHASAQDGQFRLGAVFDLDCDQGGSPWWELTPRDRNAVRVELEGHELRSETLAVQTEGSLRLVGVALPEDWFEDAVRLPDGRRAVDHGAVISVSCRALARAAEAERAWLSVPVEVRAELGGYEPLVFHYTLAEGEPSRRDLVPRPR